MRARFAGAQIADGLRAPAALAAAADKAIAARRADTARARAISLLFLIITHIISRRSAPAARALYRRQHEEPSMGMTMPAGWAQKAYCRCGVIADATASVAAFSLKIFGAGDDHFLRFSRRFIKHERRRVLYRLVRQARRAYVTSSPTARLRPLAGHDISDTENAINARRMMPMLIISLSC